MTNNTQQIVNKAWIFAHVLWDDGLSYMAYTEQITFLLFLKMADEQTKPPIVPTKFNWESLRKREGDELEAPYRHPRRTRQASRGCWAKSSRRLGRD